MIAMLLVISGIVAVALISAAMMSSLQEGEDDDELGN